MRAMADCSRSEAVDETEDHNSDGIHPGSQISTTTGTTKKRRKQSVKTRAEALRDFEAFQDQLFPKERKAERKTFIDLKKDVDTGKLVPKPGKKYERKPRSKMLKEPVQQMASLPDLSATSSAPRDIDDDDAPCIGDKFIDGTESMQPFIEFLTTLEMEHSLPKSKETEWQQRKRALDENWLDVRQKLLCWRLMKNRVPEQGTCCNQCTDLAAIRCRDCRNVTCSSCDDGIHAKHHFHRREIWKNGYFQPISNRETLIEDEVRIKGRMNFHMILRVCSVKNPTEIKRLYGIENERALPGYMPRSCPKCSAIGSFTSYCSESIITIVTDKGRFEFNDTMYHCGKCLHAILASAQQNMVMSGFWPATPHLGTTYYSTEVFQLWEAISSHSPGTSLSAFVKTLESISGSYGRLNSVNATTFSKSFHEWKRSNDLISCLAGEDNFTCPVCIQNCHSIHIDGHRKTYRFKKVPRGLEEPLYGGKFIASDEDVREHMKILYDNMGSQDYRDDKMCGASYWQAARSRSSSSFTSLDETGLVVAGCRHVIALKAVNMFAGEQYGYALYLHKMLAEQLNFKFIWQDIMCKYWPWLEKVCRKMPEMSRLLPMSKALSVMHAKAHSLDCQIVWGGLYQNYAALSTGESMEQFFSYLAKCGITTKNMSAAARNDSLTEHTDFWNGRKIANLDASLAKQYKKTKNKLDAVLNELEGLKRESPLNIDDGTIQSWENDLRAKATESVQRRSSTAVANTYEEYFRLYEEQETASTLESFLKASDEGKSIITGQEEIFRVFVNGQKEMAKKRKRLQQLESQLVSSRHTKEEALRNGKKISTESTLELLRTRILHAYLNIQQQKLEISRLADTSKKRTKIRRNISLTTTALRTTVERHNTVASLCNSATLRYEDVLAGRFSWRSENVPTQVSIPEWQQKQIVDKFVITKRCREELKLCVEEMEAFCTFYQEKLQKLRHDKKSLEHCISDLDNDCQLESIISRVEIDFPPNTKMREVIRNLAHDGIYCLFHAMKSIKDKGIEICKRRLASGATTFRNALGKPVVPWHLSVDEEPSSDEEESSEDEGDQDTEEVETTDQEQDTVLDSLASS